MGEYEPRDSRKVTRKQNRAPGEPPRTGPREDEARRQAQQTELEQDESGLEGEATVAQEEGQEALREAAMERDAEELYDEPGDRND